MNIENHPKIKMHTDIGQLEKMSGNNKIDFKKVFTPEEQKLIMLDTAYFFQRDSTDIFTNVNIIKKILNLLEKKYIFENISKNNIIIIIKISHNWTK